MTFLSPITAAVAAAIVIPALIALYFLKLRRRRLDVSTTLLWKKAIQDMQVNSPFQKLRRNLLLLLQLLLLAALLLAMARPTTRTVANPGRRVVVVIDHSASMNASDAGGGQTRLAAAKQAALELVDQFNAGAGSGGSTNGHAKSDSARGLMVVAFAQQARVVQPFTADLPRLKQRIKAIEPTDQRSRLGPALDLIEPFAQQAAADKHSGLVVYVISDGRIEYDPAHPLSLAGAQLRYIKVGGQGGSPGEGNVGIVAFSARRDADQPGDVRVFVRLANFGSSPVTTNVTLRLDGNMRRVQSVTIPHAKMGTAGNMGATGGLSASAGGTGTSPPAGKPPVAHQGNGTSSQATSPGEKSLEFRFALAGGAMVEVSQDHRDLLAADDAAWLALAPAHRLRVLLVGKGNAFLERVIRSLGVHDLVRMDPATYEQQSPQDLRRGSARPQAGGAPTSAAGYDVIVFDDYAPKHVPPVSSLSFGSAPPIPGLKLVRAAEPASADGTAHTGSGPDKRDTRPAGPQVILDWKRESPIMRYVALDDVLVNNPGRLVVPNDATVLATGQSGPIIAQAPAAGHLHVVVSFDVLQSNWPLYVSFPVFMSNAIQTLGLGALADEAGLSYTTGQAAAIPVAADQSTLSYAGPIDLTASVSNARAVLPMFTRVGVYQTNGDVEPAYKRLAVNLLDASESDMRPADTLHVGAKAVQGKTQSKVVRREVWYWFVWTALGLLLIEWFVYTRRMHV